MLRTNKRPASQTARAPRTAFGRGQPIPFYIRYCGWCGRTVQWRTDGRNLFCGHCGH